jgi:hypothetical protein
VEPIIAFAKSGRLLDYLSDAALKKLSRGNYSLTAKEKLALKELLQKMAERDFKLPV